MFYSSMLIDFLHSFLEPYAMTWYFLLSLTISECFYCYSLSAIIQFRGKMSTKTKWPGIPHSHAKWLKSNSVVQVKFIYFKEGHLYYISFWNFILTLYCPQTSFSCPTCTAGIWTAAELSSSPSDHMVKLVVVGQPRWVWRWRQPDVPACRMACSDSCPCPAPPAAAPSSDWRYKSQHSL